MVGPFLLWVDYGKRDKMNGTFFLLLALLFVYLLTIHGGTRQCEESLLQLNVIPSLKDATSSPLVLCD